MADEASEDSGETMASSVQHHSSRGSFYCHLGATAICKITNEKHSVCYLFSLIFSQIHQHCLFMPALPYYPSQVVVGSISEVFHVRTKIWKVDC